MVLLCSGSDSSGPSIVDSDLHTEDAATRGALGCGCSESPGGSIGEWTVVVGRRLVRAVAPLVLGVCVLGSVSPALAKSYSAADAKGDVVRYDDVFGDQQSAGVVDPTRSAGDVVALKTFHGPHRVKLTMTFVSLPRPTKDSTTVHLFSLKTAAQRNYNLAILPEPGHPQGDRYFARRNGTTVKCRDLKTSIDYAHKQVKASIPRACLGKPRWVRAGGAEGTYDGYYDDPDTVTVFSDDALRTGRAGDDIEAPIALGPRVRRG